MNTKIKNLRKLNKPAILIIVAFCFLILFPIQKVWASEITAKNVIQLINKERFSQGLDVLTENTVLDSAAQNKIGDMIKNDYFAHTSPGGVSPWHWIEKSGYDYKYAGENLAINFSSAEDQQRAWMTSSTHKKNILNPNYREIGVAVAEGRIDGETSIITVQLFGTRAAAYSRSPESAQPQTESRAVQGEQVSESQNEKGISSEPVTFVPLSKELKISEIHPEKINITEPTCQNGVCYFNEINSLLSQNEDAPEGMAWLAVILILVFSIILNTITLSRRDTHNPFIAANTVVLLLVLTSVVFWKI